MKIISTTLLLLLVLTSCRGAITRHGTPVALPSGSITIQNMMPYGVDSMISDNIKDECEIGQQLSDSIKKAAEGSDLDLRGVDAVDTRGPGNILKIEITHAVSKGHPGLGHRKGTSIKGELFENGKLLASFSGARISSGGFLGKYRSSCSVLGRTVDALGKDVVTWLTQPSNNAYLGDESFF